MNPSGLSTAVLCGPERRGSCTSGPQMLEISQKYILCRNIFLEIVVGSVGFKGLHLLPCLHVDRSRFWLDAFDGFFIAENIHLEGYNPTGDF